MSSTEKIPEDLIASLRLFSFILGNGTLDEELLPEEIGDYRKHIVQFGSELEMIYTIYLRNLEIDSNGKVLDDSLAQKRAAQWIRSYIDPKYVVDPPFTAEETRLAGP